ncbi:MAG: acyl-CoA dehydrogenase [Hydrogenophaga sp.]|uniref:acyl-CoA dehydrogenase family protein n=1 Tax=Hydrogenophaga sp. TaxID=1904254 RepID=UPI0016B4939D|nr:acyl-CoA dehydrogenase family protein [Hydrogenophaga sp.]NIM42982.1 acyl-CoA dehydrogenase [Hydrogenophaga sp.]NIN27912.1 acyl-CoA dehydrogenase [Hydrogenophaga sp.]NIN32689.1 acyl-CoA dehydrogenase [Hydrogenophaga sp.]NIN57185.1 acyl-CoA dehydrogenase [Hydrogenophaga sp.]NIO53601.1 acyl-CoA dehydrogenase [Hydrogenophaga sp.]
MSWTYEAPLDHMRFVLGHVLDAPTHWKACEAFADLDLDTADAVLQEAARFASEVLQPLNSTGDLEGCVREADGRVRTPTGFPAAYQAFVAGGWPALPCTPDWGGQGLPLLLDAALREMLDACNHGWNMYPDLLHGAYETIKAHASEELKARYLPKIVSGEWLAAMALTEPQAGSDLGQLRTRAEPQADGSLRISGNKIFISGGEHDLTDNIVHLVLCRLPDAPKGTKGLSLALVPKRLPDGSRNALFCDGVEKKLGIKASATCAMRYEGATGWLIGEPHRGLAAMFLMMNSARLHVGLQGLGHQEMATQNARRYAAERVQMGRPIAGHPAVRQLLDRLDTMTRAQRVLAYRAALALDLAEHHGDTAVREREKRFAALLTPIVKAFCTHQGFHGPAAALGVWGGYGYVHDYGIEQTVRDARIAMIYEGTNEIQAIDLAQRKLLADGGATAFELLDALRSELHQTGPLRDFIDDSQAHLRRWLEGAAQDGTRLLESADDLLHAMAHTLLAWAVARMAAAAHALPDEAAARQASLTAAFTRDALPQGRLHWQRALAASAAA